MNFGQKSWEKKLRKIEILHSADGSITEGSKQAYLRE